MENNSLFCERLKEERRALGKSQAEIAQLIGVSREMWGKYERGKVMPSAEVMMNLIALNADVLYILAGKRSVTLSEEEQEVLKLWRKASFLTKNTAFQTLTGKQTNNVTNHQVIDAPVRNVAGRDLFDQSKNK